MVNAAMFSELSQKVATMVETQKSHRQQLSDVAKSVDEIKSGIDGLKEVVAGLLTRFPVPTTPTRANGDSSNSSGKATIEPEPPDLVGSGSLKMGGAMVVNEPPAHDEISTTKLASMKATSDLDARQLFDELPKSDSINDSDLIEQEGLERVESMVDKGFPHPFVYQMLDNTLEPHQDFKRVGSKAIESAHQLFDEMSRVLDSPEMKTMNQIAKRAGNYAPAMRKDEVQKVERCLVLPSATELQRGTLITPVRAGIYTPPLVNFDHWMPELEYVGEFAFDLGGVAVALAPYAAHLLPIGFRMNVVDKSEFCLDDCDASTLLYKLDIKVTHVNLAKELDGLKVVDFFVSTKYMRAICFDPGGVDQWVQFIARGIRQTKIEELIRLWGMKFDPGGNRLASCYPGEYLLMSDVFWIFIFLCGHIVVIETVIPIEIHERGTDICFSETSLLRVKELSNARKDIRGEEFMFGKIKLSCCLNIILACMKMLPFDPGGNDHHLSWDWNYPHSAEACLVDFTKLLCAICLVNGDEFRLMTLVIQFGCINSEPVGAALGITNMYVQRAVLLKLSTGEDELKLAAAEIPYVHDNSVISVHFQRYVCDELPFEVDSVWVAILLEANLVDFSRGKARDTNGKDSGVETELKQRLVIFSLSTIVYDQPNVVPCIETYPFLFASSYGHSWGGYMPIVADYCCLLPIVADYCCLVPIAASSYGHLELFFDEICQPTTKARVCWCILLLGYSCLFSAPVILPKLLYACLKNMVDDP